MAEIGPLVLAGSGEYTPTMEIVDHYLISLLDGRPVVLVATACAMEGESTMTRWEQMGVAHFRRLGVEARPVRISDTDDANNRDCADLLEGAGLVWFSGGSALYLAQTFAGTLAWEALAEANRLGGAVAGASGGLGVLNPHVPNPEVAGPTGLGLAAPVRAMSHFDRAEARRPERVQQAIESLGEGEILVGVDEDTAIVWTAGAWRAMGHKRVQVFERGRPPALFQHGDVIDLLPPPVRALSPD